MKTEIRKALTSERYKFKDLAERMGYHHSYLSLVLNKKKKAPQRFFFVLCACLNEMTGSTFTTQDFKEYTLD